MKFSAILMALCFSVSAMANVNVSRFVGSYKLTKDYKKAVSCLSKLDLKVSGNELLATNGTRIVVRYQISKEKDCHKTDADTGPGKRTFCYTASEDKLVDVYSEFGIIGFLETKISMKLDRKNNLTFELAESLGAAELIMNSEDEFKCKYEKVN